MPKRSFCKTLSAPGLLKDVRACFDGIEDTTASRGLALSDCLMLGLAIFGLKYPSLLQFDQDRNDALTQSNLKSLYGIERARSDTSLRERLVEVSAWSTGKSSLQEKPSILPG